MSDVRFTDMSKKVYSVHPIQKAVNVDGAHKKVQMQKHGRETFVDCPGIYDYKSQGWIMTAWDEFKIYASENATMAYTGCEKRTSELPIPQPIKEPPEMGGAMSQKITDGIPPETTCPVKRLQPLHFVSPWRVDTKEGITLLLMPPTYHSDIGNDIMIFPGVVDYTSKFATLNVILAPRKEGVFTIKAGTPLLHIIPIVKKEYNATYGPAKNTDPLGVIANAKQFYRKYVMKRAKYSLEFDEPE